MGKEQDKHDHGLLKLHGQVLCILWEKIVGQCLKDFNNNFWVLFQKRLEIYFSIFFFF